MSDELVRRAAPGNPGCPAEHVKATLAGADRANQPVAGARRVVLLAVGGGSLATGVAGMFLPLVPTTCFLLLAAWCFSKSSPRAHYWMYNNRWFGEYLRDYRAGRGIPSRVKVGSLAALWTSIAFAVIFAVSVMWVRVVLVGIALAVTAHVATQRTTPLETGR